VKVIKFFVINLAFIGSLVGYIDVLELQNTYNCVKDTENAMLSPLVGAISFHSGWIENFYRFGEDSAVHKLVHKLFYYNQAAHDFAVTKSSQSIVQILAIFGLVPELIKWYIEYRDTYFEAQQRFEKDVAKASEEKVEKACFEPDKKTFKALDHIGKEFKKKLEGLLEEKASIYQDFLRKDDPEIDEASAGKSLSHRVRDLKKNLLDPIINSLVESQKSDNSLLPPFVLEQILATYWYLSQENKDSISDYINVLRGPKGKCTLPPESVYDYSELMSLKDVVNDESRVKELFNDPEKLAIFLLQELTVGLNPPFIPQENYRFGSMAGIRDCVESTVHNFLNFILYDAESRSYNFDLLPESVKKSVDGRLRDFYGKYHLGVTVSREAGQAWFVLIASLCTDLCKTYQECNEKRFLNPGDCVTCARVFDGRFVEANGDERNFIAIINTLLGIHSVSFRGFGQILSDKRRFIDIQGDCGNFSVTINDRVANVGLDFEHELIDFESPPVYFPEVFSVITQKMSDNNFYLLLDTLNPSLVVDQLSNSWMRDHYLFVGMGFNDGEVVINVLNAINGVYGVEKAKKFIRELINREDVSLVDGWRVPIASRVEADLSDFIFTLQDEISELVFNEKIDEIRENFNLNIEGSGWTLLTLAATRGKWELFKKLKDEGVDLSKKDAEGTPLLMHAIKGENTDIFNCVLSVTEDMDELDGYGKTALMHAAAAGNKAFFDELVKQGANIKAQDTYRASVLMHAAEGGNLEIIAYLLANGADIRARDSLDRDIFSYVNNPFFLDAKNQNPEVEPFLQDYKNRGDEVLKSYL